MGSSLFLSVILSEAKDPMPAAARAMSRTSLQALQADAALPVILSEAKDLMPLQAGCRWLSP